MPASVEIAERCLVITIEGADKIWSLRSRLDIPLEHVLGAERDEEETGRWWDRVRAPGAHLPGVLTVGTFHQHGERVFWDVHHPEKAIAIRLRDERYPRLVVDVEDPDAAVSRSNAELSAHS